MTRDFWDERNGEALNPATVTKVRSEEITFMAKIEWHEEADIKECMETIEKPAIGTRWVDVNKGSVESPDVRCRLVARDLKPKGERTGGTCLQPCLRWKRKKNCSSARPWEER